MSPALKQRKADEQTSSIPAVAEAMARQREAELTILDRTLAAYLEAVTLAAAGKPIPAAVADSAVVAAHGLRLRHDRLSEDVAVARLAMSMEQQIAEHEAGSAARRARMEEIKQEIVAAERLVRELRAEHHRLTSSGMVLATLRTQRSELGRDNPHLFKRARDLSNADWQRVRG